MPELLEVSSHVLNVRWPQRSADRTTDPRDAWTDGKTIYGHGLEGDEARYHAPTGTVLVRKDDTLITVIRADTAKPSVQHAIYYFGGEQA